MKKRRNPMRPMIPLLPKKNMLTVSLMIQAIKDTTSSMYEVGKNRLLYTIDITGQNSVLYDFLHQHFQYADDIVVTRAKDDESDETEVLFETLWCQHMTYAGINHRDVTVINGIPCMLHAYGLGGGDKKESTRNIRALTISTLRVNGYPEALRKMLREEYFKGVERNRAESANRKKRYIKAYSPGGVLDTLRIVKRTFENVYVPKEIKDQITVNVDNFMFRKKWFLDNAIPYHFGIMLYGSAGTGKTSLAQAIANYVPRSTIFYMNGDDIMHLPRLIKLMKSMDLDQKYPNVVIVEDIDCGFDTGKLSKRDKKNDDEDDSEKTGLATLLNNLDGISAPFNTIFIFTTNHIEALDPALIRPGRIDICLEIKPVCTETFKEFMKHHFGDDIKFPAKFKVKENFVTFAKLQTMVMNNCSIQEIVDYVNAYPKRSIGKNESVNK